MRLVTFTALTIALGTASPAAATHAPSHPPSEASAFDQYVEQIPSAAGDRPVGGGGTKQPLPANVLERVRSEGGQDAAVLEAIATDPARGAPARSLSPAPAIDRDEAGDGALAAVASVAAEGSAGRVRWLGVVLLVVTAALTGAAIARRRPA